MIWYFAPRIVAAAMAIVVLMVLTRVLGAADFGRYNIVILSGTTAFAFLFAWLATSIARFHPDAEFDGKTIAYVLGAGLRIAVVIVPLGIAGYFLLPDGLSDLVGYAMLYCICHALHDVGLSCLRVWEERKKFAAVTLTRPLLGVALAVIFVLNGGGYTSAVLGMALGALLSGGYAVAIAVRRAGVAVPRKFAVRSFLSFGGPLALVTSVSSLYVLISQSLLALFASLEAVGYFAAANMLTMRTLRMTMSHLMRAVAAKIFRDYELHGQEESDKALGHYFSVLMLLSMPILVLLVFGGQPIASLLFEPDFANQVVPYLRILAVSAFLMGMQGAYFSFSFMRSKRTVLQLAIMFGSVGFHALVSLVLIRLLGAHGASYAFLASGIATLVVFVVVGRAINPIAIPVGETARTLPGVAAFALFVYAIDFIESPFLQIVIVVAGLLVMMLLLVASRQQAALFLVDRIRQFAKL